MPPQILLLCGGGARVDPAQWDPGGVFQPDQMFKVVKLMVSKVVADVAGLPFFFGPWRFSNGPLTLSTGP